MPRRWSIPGFKLEVGWNGAIPIDSLSMAIIGMERVLAVPCATEFCEAGPAQQWAHIHPGMCSNMRRMTDRPSTIRYR